MVLTYSISWIIIQSDDFT